MEKKEYKASASRLVKKKEEKLRKVEELKALNMAEQIRRIGTHIDQLEKVQSEIMEASDKAKRIHSQMRDSIDELEKMMLKVLEIVLKIVEAP